jgi:hypothetical protein
MGNLATDFHGYAKKLLSQRSLRNHAEDVEKGGWGIGVIVSAPFVGVFLL